jgi:O-antigen/teichoic acid export membrane protein
MEELRKILFKSFRQIGLIMFPAAWLVAVVAPVLIVPILGEKYAPYQSSFIVLSMLAVYAGNRTMLSIFFEAYKSIGKPWIVWAYNSVKLVIMIPAMIYGAEHGIIGLALTYIPIQIIEFPVAVFLANRILAISVRQVWRASWIPIVSTFIMCAVTVTVELAMKRQLHLGDTVTLFTCLLVGGIVYVGALLVFDRRILREGMGVLSRGL